MRQLILAGILGCTASLTAQNGITNTANSTHAVMNSLPVTSVRWTGGFWGERFGVFSQTSVQSMWQTWQSKEGKGFTNFLVAAGEQQGEHHGPPFHDGDMYKWLEAVASVYAITRDPELDAIMDRFIGLVAKAQRADGYIHTPVIIKERNAVPSVAVSQQQTEQGGPVGTTVGTKNDNAFENRLNFETYNLGHLIMAGIMHRRATGKTTLYDCAVRAADFLYDFCQRAPEELAGNAICPSHYMGVAELYRETGDAKYLELLRRFIDIRGMVQNGTDDNQDRIPFRQQYRAMGHAVRANYLYAGVADLYLESGEEQLMHNLTAIWQDITQRKMYINGACGALYDGTSPDGTNYTPDSIQKVHQSYGRPYQLPHATAHNETCANIGNMLFNWRMLLATGDAKYADLVENCLYNSILCGISLDGEHYFYTNPLRLTDKLPYKLRWPKERRKYISCFCCPPNTLRTLCQAQDYVYTTAERRLYVNTYGESRVTATVGGVGTVSMSQQTDYPWDGHVSFTVDALIVFKNTPSTRNKSCPCCQSCLQKAFKNTPGTRNKSCPCCQSCLQKAKKGSAFDIALRIPSWTETLFIKVNGEPADYAVEKGYAIVSRQWKTGDVLTCEMSLEPRVIEANPLVEENRGQVAVMRGPILYCLESTDLAGEPGIPADIDDIALPVNARFTPVEVTIGGSRMMALETEAYVRGGDDWRGQLYRPAAVYKEKKTVRLIPYYAWGNRGKSEMTVWIPAVY